MNIRPALPRLAVWLLRAAPLGDRRDDVEADLAELFDLRRRERGRVHAYTRLISDLASVVRSERTRGRSSVAAAWLIDLRYALRLLRRHPAVIGVTAGGLAVAIAVGTTIFTILNANLLRPYAMDDPSSVVRVQMRFTDGSATTWPYRAFAELHGRPRQSTLVASMNDTVSVTRAAGESPTQVDAITLVSGDYFATLGGRAMIGRPLSPADDEPGAPPLVVVSERFWKTRLSGDRSIVGRTIWLSGSPVTVVGVIDSSFTGPVDAAPLMWTPFAAWASIDPGRGIDRSSSAQVWMTARVAPDADRTAVERELSSLASALPDVGITEDAGLVHVAGVRLEGAASPMDGADSVEALAVVGVVLLVVGLVLALACANVANLLLAGASARAREIGLRLALGASRGRVVRQLISESVLIGALAGVAGFLLATWLLPVLTTTLGLTDRPEIRPDARVALFTAAISLVCGVAAGLAPARYGSRGDLVGALKSQSAQAGAAPAANRMRRVFVGMQAACSILLLVTSALFLRASVRLVHVDLGFDADKLLAAAPSFPSSGFDAPAVDAYWRMTTAQIRAIPGVEHASLASYAPFGGEVGIRQIPSRSRAGVGYLIYENRTDAEYFAAVGFHVLRGRTYTPDDVRARLPVAVISDTVARDFYADADPIGASLGAVSRDLSGITVIGVVNEAVARGLHGLGNGAIYRPLSAGDLRGARLLIRTAAPAAVAHDVARVMQTADARVRPQTTIVQNDVDHAMNEPRLLANLSAIVALLALTLAVLGVYGVTTFVVRQRLWEMRIRQAIGASTSDIVRLLVRQSLTPVVIGLGCGLAVALAVVRLLTPALSGLSPYDPVAIAAATAVLLGAAGAAVISPSLRGARVDLAGALRDS